MPKRPLLGIDTDRHGIRMDAYIQEIPDEVDSDLADVKLIPDIYDIEPNNTYEKESLPKRIRYYHGLVDTQLLSAGVDYAKLPNVTNQEIATIQKLVEKVKRKKEVGVFYWG